MLVLRKRLIIWLLKAYFKRWGKRILFFFLIGLFFSFILKSFLGSLVAKLPTGHSETIGIVGAYTLDNLPPEVLSNLSYGLTTISEDGKAIPGAARKWQIGEAGKAYVFYLKRDIYFTDGSNLTSDLVNYKFSNTQVEKPDKYTIIYKLKDIYSPFLITISSPIFKNSLVGVGDYKVKEVKLNGSYVQSLTLSLLKDQFQTKKYNFYPTQDSLKMAFVLGEITKAIGLWDLNFNNQSLGKFPNTVVDKNPNPRLLTTIFYNTSDKVLSDKKIRNSLSYTIPEDFTFGKKAYSLISPSSWAYSPQYAKVEDFEHAKTLLSKSSAATAEGTLTLDMKVLSKYKTSAEFLSQIWKRIGITTNIEIVDSVPISFQIFLGDIYLPNDPDQYSLWHSNQDNNITNYKNLRIDKLLEDGRKTDDIDVRKKTYLDFQKYILDDNPATFLYFPYEYDITRK